MSHLIEEYAKSLGVKIGRPALDYHFFPVLKDKYITFHTNNEKVKAKHYDHWRIVFNLIFKFLEKEGISIIQVGGAEDPHLSFCHQDTRGASFKQMAYVIENSLLHLGIDSLPMHMASLYDKKIVALFSNLYIENASPIWNRKNQIKLFSPDFSEEKPSFRFDENIKRVNEIKPEEVGAAVLELLGIENDLSNINTLSIGCHYQNKITEIIPDFIPEADEHINKLINLRCDYDLMEESLIKWLTRKTNLMINKPIDINTLNFFKENIAGLTIFLGENDFSEEYFENLNKLNINFNLISRHKDKLPDLRLQFFDYTIEEYVSYFKKDLDFTSEICDDTYYHSNKTLISKNKKYSSKAAWKQGIETTQEHQKIIDNDDFWEEFQHLNIYNYAKNKKLRY